MDRPTASEGQPIQPQQPPASENAMAATSSLGRIVLVSLGVLCLGLAIAYGGFYLGQRSTPLQKISPAHIATPIPTKNSALSFQQTLSQNCTSIANTHHIDLLILPLSIPETIDTGKDQPNCWGSPGTDFIFTQTVKGDPVYMYDASSVEPGHGGYAHLGQLGTSILTTPSLTLSFYRGQGIGSYIGTENIMVRGIRKITWPDGKTVFISMDKEAIPATDPRLLAILNTYAIEGTDSLTSGHMIVDPYKEDAVSQEIVKTFFADINNLAQPEKNPITYMLQVLNGFSVK